MLVGKQSVEAFCITGTSYDCGVKLDYMQANIEYSMRHIAFGGNFKYHLRALFDCNDNSANI